MSDQDPNKKIIFRQTDTQPILVPSIITIRSDIQTDTHRYVTGHFASDPQIDFLARSNNDPEHQGISGSSVDQLVLKQGDQTLARYNRISEQSEITPQTPEHQKMVERVCGAMDKLHTHGRAQEDHEQDAEPQPEEKIQFRKAEPDIARPTNPDGSPLRDQDNAQPTLRPQNSIARPAPNLAPPGMMGIRTSPQREPEPWQPPQRESGLSMSDDVRDGAQWTEGKIMTMPGYSFNAKLYDEPSKFGIEGGKISKLDIHKDGELVVRYDRGWDKDPKTPEQKEALQRIRNGLDDTPQKDFKGFDKTQDKDHGMER